MAAWGINYSSFSFMFIISNILWISGELRDWRSFYDTAPRGALVCCVMLCSVISKVVLKWEIHVRSLISIDWTLKIREAVLSVEIFMIEIILSISV